MYILVDVCKHANAKSCSSTQFPPEHYVNMHAQVSSLAHHKLDLLLLGTIINTTEKHEEICKPVKRQ